MKVLFLASEVSPFVKTGGLADVAGSLPQALKKLGIDVRVAMPQYSQIDDQFLVDLEHLLHFRSKVAWRDDYVGVNKLDNKGVPTYFVDNKKYFNSDGIYESWEQHIQYVYFCRAVLEMLPKLDFKPDIIHCNDWQMGPISIMLKENYQQYDFYQDIKTIFTIHNLKYQGQFAPEIVEDVLCLDYGYWESGVLKHAGAVNYMKMGINMSDLVTTVSKTYAEEIQTAQYGEGLDYVLRMNADDLYGIVNGIDYDEYNPATDNDIAVNYNAQDISGKYENKRRLQQRMGLPVNEEVPVVALISRLVEQKGLDLLLGIIDELMREELQLVILGTGESRYENALREVANRYPEKISVYIKYDQQVAKNIYAGSDIFLMPSKFEPCGLSQLLSLRYGTIPLVRETGGLKDTVSAYNEFTGQGNGFSFSDYQASDLLYTLRRAINFYHQEEVWEALVKKAMLSNYSWQFSAQRYFELYRKLMGLNAKAIIDLNKASKEDLKELNGIGPALAERIINYRQNKNEFNSILELKDVSGIGDSIFTDIEDLISVEILPVRKIEEEVEDEVEDELESIDITTLYQLPDSYQDNRMVLQIRNPNSAHVYWEYTEQLMNKILDSLAINAVEEVELILRLYDLSIDSSYGVYYDIEVSSEDDNWYFFDLKPEHNYSVSLGVLDQNYHFQTILKSNLITTPSNSISQRLDEEWLKVEEWSEIEDSLAQLYKLAIAEDSTEQEQDAIKDGDKYLKESYGSITVLKKLAEEKRGLISSYASQEFAKNVYSSLEFAKGGYSSLSILKKSKN